MPCMCSDPCCHSCGPAHGWHVHSCQCVGLDGIYECGEYQYDEEEPACELCGDLSNTSICSACQRRIEEDE